ncbi:11065_t:CDS:2 [Scutellospora calospora]|uniref:11065_t:CDS:1 n=1 Tax=Scutellospora calospora TaxID=85575 RepID=A0ACA9KRA8_9GLOM|nr:11065_t:CDS:2 [Scutellospora calospora]
MSPKAYVKVVDLLPDQHQVNLRIKVIAQIMFGEVDDSNKSTKNVEQPQTTNTEDLNTPKKKPEPVFDLSKIEVAEFLVGDSSGCIILKAINDQISLLQPQTCVFIHNARVEMYRGFMRIVVDQNTNAEIKPFGEATDDKEDDIQPNLEKNCSLTEYQYVPHVVLNE